MFIALCLLTLVLIRIGHPVCTRVWSRYRILHRYPQSWRLLRWSYIIDQTFDTRKSYLAAQHDRDQFPPSLAYTYGEIPFTTLVEVLHMAQAKSGEVFYDLGAGDGRALCIALLTIPFARVCGIEQLPTLYHYSQQYTQQLSQRRHRPLHFSPEKFQLVQGDYHTYDFSDADIIYINATAIFGEHWTQLVDKFRRLKVNARIITASRKIDSPQFQLIDFQWRPLSWGPNRVYIYRKVR